MSPLISTQDNLYIKLDTGKKEKCICFYRNTRSFKSEKKSLMEKIDSGVLTFYCSKVKLMHGIMLFHAIKYLFLKYWKWIKTNTVFSYYHYDRVSILIYSISIISYVLRICCVQGTGQGEIWRWRKLSVSKSWNS